MNLPGCQTEDSGLTAHLRVTKTQGNVDLSSAVTALLNTLCNCKGYFCWLEQGGVPQKAGLQQKIFWMLCSDKALAFTLLKARASAAQPEQDVLGPGPSEAAQAAQDLTSKHTWKIHWCCLSNSTWHCPCASNSLPPHGYNNRKADFPSKEINVTLN